MEDRVQTSLIALRRILRATELNARTLARATGLTTPQFIVLSIVSEAGETTPKAIAARAGVRTGDRHRVARQAGGARPHHARARQDRQANRLGECNGRGT